MKQFIYTTLKSGSAINMGEQDVQGGISRRRTGLSDNLHVLHVLVKTVEFDNLYKFAKGETLFFFNLFEKLFLKCAIVCHIGDSFRLITISLYWKKQKSQVIVHKLNVLCLCKLHKWNRRRNILVLHKSFKTVIIFLLVLHNMNREF